MRKRPSLASNNMLRLWLWRASIIASILCKPLSVSAWSTSTRLKAVQYPWAWNQPVPRTSSSRRTLSHLHTNGRHTCYESKTRLSAIASSVASTSATPVIGTLYMVLLALQFACQPILTQKFVRKDIIKGTYVMVQDLVRLVYCVAALWATGGWASATVGWNFREAWMLSGIPAVLYMIQNYCSLTAYQNLPPITYNVMNQTKTLSAAFWCFFLLGQTQSSRQITSLFVLLASALVMEGVVPIPGLPKNTKTRAAETPELHWRAGLLPILAASLISGLAGAWIQRTLQTHARNALLLSSELAALSVVINSLSMLLGSPDGRRIRREGFWKGWTWKTWYPLLLNAMGGIIVGLVTKYAGTVRKGFALIIGMFLSGLLQNVWSEAGPVTTRQWLGGGLAALSLWMHH